MNAATKCAPHRERLRVSSIKVEQHGKSAVFENPNRDEYFVTTTDGGILGNQRVADYVVSRVGIGDLIVELKGKDVDTACKQIEATISLVNACTSQTRKGKSKRGPIAGLIVCTRVPKLDTKAQSLRNRFAKQYRSRLFIYVGNRSFRLSDFFSAGK